MTIPLLKLSWNNDYYYFKTTPKGLQAYQYFKFKNKIEEEGIIQYVDETYYENIENKIFIINDLLCYIGDLQQEIINLLKQNAFLKERSQDYED